jgi:hypothetical protein
VPPKRADAVSKRAHVPDAVLAVGAFCCVKYGSAVLIIADGQAGDGIVIKMRHRTPPSGYATL